MLRHLYVRLRSLCTWRRQEAELDEEIRFHLAEETEERIAGGMSPAEAHAAARRDFGNATLIRELARETWGWGPAERLLQDVRGGIRMMRRSPTFTTVAVGTLALAIGVNVVMFSVLNTVLFRPLPFHAPDQLAMLWTETPSQALRENRSAFWNIEEWRRQSRSFSDIAVFDSVALTLTHAGETQRIQGARVSPNLFPLLGVQPLHGRSFSADETAERRRLVVISHRLWQARFGGSLDTLGVSVELDGHASRVIGVLPERFGFASLDADIFEPHTLFPDWEDRRLVRGQDTWFVIGRLRPNVTIEGAQSEMSTIARRLDAELPVGERNRGIRVVPLSRHVVGSRSRLALWMPMAAAAFVLLIAAANVANLWLARSLGRARDVALRAALGASPARIVRQHLTESTTLAVGAGAFGMLLAVVGLDLVRSLGAVELARLDEVHLDTSVFGWSLVLSLLTGTVVGTVPALLWRGYLRPLGDTSLRGAVGGTAARNIRRSLLVAEVTLAIMLLVGAGLLIRSWWQVEGVDPGFRPERVLAMQIGAPALMTPTQRPSFYYRVLQRIESTPGVERAGFISDAFISSSPERTLTTERDGEAVSTRLQFRSDEISAGLFPALGTRLLDGRLFTPRDGPESPRVVIVNDTMARQLWPGDDAVGRRFKWGPADSVGPWLTVVGVVDDMRRQGLETEPIPQIFQPVAQNPSGAGFLIIRADHDDPLEMAAAVQAAARQVDPLAPLYGVSTLESRLRASYAPRRLQTSIVVGFAAAALLMAAIGIYGLIQYAVSTRTKEIAIRMAVGADTGNIFRMVVGEGLVLSGAGVALGLLGGVWVGHAVRRLLFGVGTLDPLTFVTGSAVLITVALAACTVPARRAMRVEPLVALRAE
ncbi:MAG: ABC transporter permease [Acidobacteria bacterium]|nr:ABC transporter permease [Acidobacteriota bacterium]MYJ05843.1 ABC transporter permease [Acidobacteriota bacterium]